MIEDVGDIFERYGFQANLFLGPEGPSILRTTRKIDQVWYVVEFNIGTGMVSINGKKKNRGYTALASFLKRISEGKANPKWA